MNKVKMFNVMSIMVAVFFLSTGLAPAQDEWETDGNSIYNTNSGATNINGGLNINGELKIGQTSNIFSFNYFPCLNKKSFSFLVNVS